MVKRVLDASKKGNAPLKNIIPLTVILLSTMGCSAMSLQCGVDGDSSFVNINAAPQVLSQNSRNLAELCGFAYEAQDET